MPLNVCYLNSQNFFIPLRVSSFFTLLHCCFRDVLKRTRVQYFFGGNSLLHSSPRPIGSVMEPAAVGGCVCVFARRSAVMGNEPRTPTLSIITFGLRSWRESAFNNQGLIQIRCSFFPALLPRGRANGRWMVGGAIGAQLVREEGSARVLLGIIE